MDSIELYAKHLARENDKLSEKEKISTKKVISLTKIMMKVCLEKARQQPDCLMMYNKVKNQRFAGFYPHLFELHNQADGGRETREYMSELLKIM